MFQATKKIDPKVVTAQNFIGVEAIANNILWTENKYLFAFLSVQGKDNSLLDEDGHVSFTDNLTMALSEETETYQILSVPRTVDTQGMIDQLQQLQRQTEHDVRLRLLGGEIDALERMAADGAKEPMLLIKIWKKAALDADKALMERLRKIKEKLEANSISSTIFTDADIRHLCRVYGSLGIWQDRDENIPRDVPTLTGRPRLFRQAEEDEQARRRRELLEEITPVGGLLFSATGLMVGSAYCRCYGVTRYPAELSYGWAVNLTNATDCITCITYYPGHDTEIGNALSKSINRNKREAKQEKDPRTRKQFERKTESADHLIDDMDARGMAIGHMSIVTMAIADSEKQLEVVCRNIVSRFAGKRMTAKVLACLQKDAFRHLSPYHPDQVSIDEMLQRIIPLETLLGGYPMTSSILRDDYGMYFAQTLDGGILSLDIMYRDADRTNSGGIVTGVPGIGKSTFLKHLLQSMYMRGVNCIVIDPEREFRDICKALGGSWWDAGGGNAKVNSLEPLDCTPDPEDDPTYRGSISPLALHIQQIQDIFRYKIPSLTDIQISLLKRVLLELYKERGITLDMNEAAIRRVPHTGWPIMTDLYQWFRREEKEDARFRDLADLFEDMAIGADSLIWNGYTNIDLSSSLVVIDTNQLYNSSEENKRAQYFNIMRLAFSKITADRSTPCLLIADESQTMIDPDMPKTAQSLLNMALRSRKYEGALWLGLHSLHEFLNDSVKKYGQPILDAPTYKILFGTDGKNLVDTVELYQLTAAERKLLESRRRGKALCLIGSRHLPVEFVIPKYKLDLMGKGGGR